MADSTQPPSPPPSPSTAPSMPTSRRSSSVSSATTVAALRTAGFRGRAVHSADEKRVTFRATPSVRYFKSTHSASFGSDDVDDDSDAQLPQWRAMRLRRTRRRLVPRRVHEQHMDDVDAPTKQLVLKIADAARQSVEAAVRELTSASGAAGWTRRRRDAVLSFRDAADGRTSEAFERRQRTAHQVVVSTVLPCRLRELQRVLETTPLDALDAALLACTHERIDRATLVETTATTLPQLREQQRKEKRGLFRVDPLRDSRQGSETVTIKRVVLPRTKMGEAAQAWRRVKHEGASEPVENETLELIDVTRTPSVKSAAVPYTSRVLQQMASLSNAGHALTGDMQVAYVLQPNASSSQETTVLLFISRKRKALKGFSWSAESVSDALVARLNAITTVLWGYVERRRFGFQVLTYPDLVYCVRDIEEAQSEVSHCPQCSNEFGFLRRRHFCHLCALWTCIKCSSEQDVETHESGWILENVRICSACQDRVHECVYDYDRGAISPAQPTIRSDLEYVQNRYSRHIAESWIRLLQRASNDEERHVYSHLLDTLATLLSPEDECNFRLSALQPDWEDLATDEMSESVEELAEMLPIPNLTRSECALSHDMTRREYVLLFDDETGYPQSPTTVDDSDRVKHVEKLSILDIPSYPTVDAVCALAANALQCRMAFMSVITTDRTLLISKCGLSTTERSRDDGFCAYTLQSIHPLVVLDLARDVRSRYFSLTTEENARFYCGIPLLSPDETFVMATFAVADTRPRQALTTAAYAMFVVFSHAARAALIQELQERARSPPVGA